MEMGGGSDGQKVCKKERGFLMSVYVRTRGEEGFNFANFMRRY